MKNSIKILDCTLRDGGYYNNWDFDFEVIESYLKSVAEANIDFVELGLRNFSQAGFHGAFAYTTEEYINSLTLPDGPIYGVMVDAKTILGSELSIFDAVDRLFVDAKLSKIGLVRIAAHFHEVKASENIARKLKEKGYLVGLNMMQAGGKSTEIISEMASCVNSWECVDALYFADSLGNMDFEEVVRITSAIKQSWLGDIGIHTHNNMGKALNNTLAAKDSGVTWLDVTITGMGRGAGNAQTETLLATLDSESYKPEPIYDLVIRYFEDMQKEYGWGASLPYFLGAKADIHPTYIQTLISSEVYGKDEVIDAIKYLSKVEGTSSYNSELLTTAISFSGSKNNPTGSTDIEGLLKEREVLIIASGPSTQRYLKDIEAYIRNHNPVVIAVNVSIPLSEDFIDYYCVSHNSKFVSQSKLYSSLSKPIIAPLHRFSESEKNVMEGHGVKALDFGFEVVPAIFSVQPTYCQAPYDVTFAYALGVATCANAAAIKVVGIDGYPSNDPRQLEMIEICNMYNGLARENEIIALTPTTYPITQMSIFSPKK
ncbi:aldolase catalytic domain-containing protein [Vibrio sp. T11.5]|uniref:aldolase catalytic domain-containing protein n=1 Tax=Vibrio sp. T11.5 TaxID=2998836 RepID=UPI0022CD29AD|nr:pyruvate carboxyltransferase [Vibrio sp. T11.5]MDA0119783.1 pyruvate carboxyltransferase [Vibrio sp. T11.5]